MQWNARFTQPIFLSLILFLFRVRSPKADRHTHRHHLDVPMQSVDVAVQYVFVHVQHVDALVQDVDALVQDVDALVQEVGALVQDLNLDLFVQHDAQFTPSMLMSESSTSTSLSSTKSHLRLRP